MGRAPVHFLLTSCWLLVLCGPPLWPSGDETGHVVRSSKVTTDFSTTPIAIAQGQSGSITLVKVTQIFQKFCFFLPLMFLSNQQY